MSRQRTAFETRRGTCHVDNGSLVFEESVRGYYRNLYEGYWVDGIWWQKLVPASHVVFALSLPAFVFLYGPEVTGALVLVVGIAVLGRIGYQRFVRGFRQHDRLAIDSIESATLVPGRKGLTRPRIRLRFEDDGTTYRRQVDLPSLTMPGGRAKRRAARDALADHGVPVTVDD